MFLACRVSVRLTVLKCFNLTHVYFRHSTFSYFIVVPPPSNKYEFAYHSNTGKWKTLRLDADGRDEDASRKTRNRTDPERHRMLSCVDVSNHVRRVANVESSFEVHSCTARRLPPLAFKLFDGALDHVFLERLTRHALAPWQVDDSAA